MTQRVTDEQIEAIRNCTAPSDKVSRDLCRDLLDTRAALAEREATIAGYEEMAQRFSALLCRITGNHMSNTGYAVDTMEAEVDEYYEQFAQESIAAETAILRAEVERLRGALSNCYAHSRRELRRLGKQGGSGKAEAARWSHIKRFCEAAGLQPNILRDAAPAPPEPACEKGDTPHA